MTLNSLFQADYMKYGIWNGIQNGIRNGIWNAIWNELNRLQLMPLEDLTQLQHTLQVTPHY